MSDNKLKVKTVTQVSPINPVKTNDNFCHKSKE